MFFFHPRYKINGAKKKVILEGQLKYSNTPPDSGLTIGVTRALKKIKNELDKQRNKNEYAR
jgi:hypothetical protein